MMRPQWVRRPPRVSAGQLLFLSAFFVIYFVWGSTYLAGRIAVAGVPPLLLVAARTIPAGALLLLIARLRGPRNPDVHPRWSDALIAGTLMFALGQGALMRALQGVPSGLASVLVATVPLWVLLLSRIRPTTRTPWAPAEIAGVAVGLLGIVLLTAPWDVLAGNEIAPFYALILVGCALSWAAGTVFIRGTSLAASPLRGTAMQLLAGGTVATVAAALTGEPGLLAPHSVTPAVVGSVAYLSLAGSLLGFLCYGWLLSQTTATRVATYAYVNPVVALGAGWALGGEVLDGRILLATAVTLVGVALVVGRRRSSTVRAATGAPARSIPDANAPVASGPESGLPEGGLGQPATAEARGGGC